MVVYNPSSREAEAEANVWYEYFVEKNKYAPLLQDRCVVVVLWRTLVSLLEQKPAPKTLYAYATRPSRALAHSHAQRCTVPRTHAS